MDEEDIDVKEAEDGMSIWDEYSIGELKQEIQRIEVIQKTLRQSKLDTDEVQARLDCLKQCVRGRLSTGQRLDSLSA